MSTAIREQIGRLEQRLAELERERDLMRALLAAQRRPRGLTHWRALGGLGLAVILVGIGLLAAPSTEAKTSKAAKPHVVQAPFHVVDKAGKVILKVEGGGDFPLQVNDSAGKMIFAATEGKHRGITLFNKTDGIMVLAGESPKGNGMVETRGADPDNSSILGGAGGLAIWKGDVVLMDAPAKKRCEIGRQGMKIYDGNEQPLVALRADTGNQYGILILGKAGKGLVQLSAQDDVGDVIVLGTDGKSRAIMSDKGFQAFDKSGNAIARIGPDAKGSSGFVGLGKDKNVLVELVSLNGVGEVVLRGPDDKSIVELGKSGVQVLNKGNVVGLLGFAPSGNGNGYFSIGKGLGGGALLEGGVLPDGRGVMRAYPFKPRAGDILVGQNLIIGAKE